MSPGMKFFFSRIFPLLFILVGASVLFLGLRGLVRAKASVDWPNTQGEIVESSVDRRRSSGNDGSSTTYHAEILYEFSVDGTLFNGSRVAYGDYGSSNPSHARRIVNNYPKGKSVTVYYMPGNPEESLLEPGVKAKAWFVPGFGLIFFIAGSLMAAFLPMAIRKQEKTKQNLGGNSDNRAADGTVPGVPHG